MKWKHEANESLYLGFTIETVWNPYVHVYKSIEKVSKGYIRIKLKLYTY